MIDKIIALVDGSEYSQSVCDHAAWVAQRTGAPVELLHVLGRRDADGKQDLSGAIRLGARSALLDELAELDAQRSRLMGQRGRAILDDARDRLEQDGISEITVQLRQGDLVEAVAERQDDTRVVVIGKRGEAADFARGHLGSNMERILRSSRKPVFVASRAFRPVETVLIAWDGSASSRNAVEKITQSALFEGLALHLVSVGEAAARGRDDAQAALSRAGLSVQSRTIPGEPETALGELVEAEGFDMVVMGAHGHSRIRNLIVGSTTTATIRACKVPVVLFR
ncbi:Nucleotide-binding universal stress protein, UspA family [Paracoccus isoporae]|uniref:Nucleotide-binding universal stress protein, UspA family n=1 Tax=Paracoccus isoporae TaxID=591205 RepID=A0A1G7EJV4_9RHOB|nr:universal stress protein [Paracoccus isoporae]SDE63924.1 Nucleotide-binding universal stress protein, UspA family [Paracoccus isoporae]